MAGRVVSNTIWTQTDWRDMGGKREAHRELIEGSLFLGKGLLSLMGRNIPGRCMCFPCSLFRDIA